jgi:antitoxin YefM
MTTTSLADAKNRLSELVSSAEKTHERTIITKNGRPVAALIGIEDLESLEETLEIMSDPQLVAELREAMSEVERGEVETLTYEQGLELVRSRRART